MSAVGRLAACVVLLPDTLRPIRAAGGELERSKVRFFRDIRVAFAVEFVPVRRTIVISGLLDILLADKYWAIAVNAAVLFACRWKCRVPVVVCHYGFLIFVCQPSNLSLHGTPYGLP